MPNIAEAEQPSIGDYCPGGNSILLIEPNEVIRLGLVAVFRSIETVASVTGCETTPRLDTALEERRQRPGRAGILAMSSTIGIDEIRSLEVRAAQDHMRTLLILHSLDDPSFVEYSQRFAHGLVLLEDITTEHMSGALERLERQEEVMLPVRVAGQLLQRPRALRNGPHQSRQLLTQREVDVLTLLSQGYSNKQIAPRIGISEHGVKRHVANVLAKLNCSNRTQAVSLALQRGLLAESRLTPAM